MAEYIAKMNYEQLIKKVNKIDQDVTECGVDLETRLSELAEYEPVSTTYTRAGTEAVLVEYSTVLKENMLLVTHNTINEEYFSALKIGVQYSDYKFGSLKLSKSETYSPSYESVKKLNDASGICYAATIDAPLPSGISNEYIGAVPDFYRVHVWIVYDKDLFFKNRNISVPSEGIYLGAMEFNEPGLSSIYYNVVTSITYTENYTEPVSIRDRLLLNSEVFRGSGCIRTKTIMLAGDGAIDYTLDSTQYGEYKVCGTDIKVTYATIGNNSVDYSGTYHCLTISPIADRPNARCLLHYYIDKDGKHHADCRYLNFLQNITIANMSTTTDADLIEMPRYYVE